MDDDAVRWLTDDEELAWLSLISVLMQLQPALDAQLQRDSGLSFYEYGVLASLSQVDDTVGLRMSDLAAVTNGQLPRLSQVITRMEKRAWVERCADPDDGRATRVVLLPAGTEVLDAAAPGHVDQVRELVFDQLTETQVRRLHGICRTISQALGTPPLLLDIERQRSSD
ncbi:MAG: MarR family transcriptional regulator [Ilumatobacteraceae bacterium]|nr:MarR family transcriptional regulator [Ilumatobacteraceae bacterium]